MNAPSTEIPVSHPLLSESIPHFQPLTVLVTPYIEFPRQISASGDLEKYEDL